MTHDPYDDPEPGLGGPGEAHHGYHHQRDPGGPGLLPVEELARGAQLGPQRGAPGQPGLQAQGRGQAGRWPPLRGSGVTPDPDRVGVSRAEYPANSKYI